MAPDGSISGHPEPGDAEVSREGVYVSIFAHNRKSQCNNPSLYNEVRYSKFCVQISN